MASGRNPNASKNFVENLNKLAISEHTGEVKKLEDLANLNDLANSDIGKGNKYSTI